MTFSVFDIGSVIGGHRDCGAPQVREDCDENVIRKFRVLRHKSGAQQTSTHRGDVDR
jgi:hypothetical protein